MLTTWADPAVHTAADARRERIEAMTFSATEVCCEIEPAELDDLVELAMREPVYAHTKSEIGARLIRLVNKTIDQLREKQMRGGL